MSKFFILTLSSLLAGFCHLLRQIVQKKAQRLVRLFNKQLEWWNARIKEFSKEFILHFFFAALLNRRKRHPQKLLVQTFVLLNDSVLHQDIEERKILNSRRCTYDFDLIARDKHDASIWMKAGSWHAALLQARFLKIIRLCIDCLEQTHSLRVGWPLSFNHIEFRITGLDPIENLLFFGLFGKRFDLCLLLNAADLRENY